MTFKLPLTLNPDNPKSATTIVLYCWICCAANPLLFWLMSGTEKAVKQEAQEAYTGKMCDAMKKLKNWTMSPSRKWTSLQ
jgi:hypothetical protein